MLSFALVLSACAKNNATENPSSESTQSGEIVVPNISEEQYEMFQFVLLADNTYEVRKGEITNQESVTIPNVYNGKLVTSIAQSAFSGCNIIKNVTIPETVTSIGSYAFYNCVNLTSVNIPKSVKNVGTFPFEGCENIEYSAFGNGKYLGNTENKYFYLACAVDKNITDIQINENTQIIGNYAFSDCVGLTAVTVPDSVRVIGEYSFSGCIGLTEFYLSKTITEIGEYAFEDCKSLTDIVIPEGMEKLSADTFIGCIGLKSVTLPVSIKTIGLWAFEGCNNMESINYIGTKEQFDGITIGVDKANSILVNNYVTVKGQNIKVAFNYVPEVSE